MEKTKKRIIVIGGGFAGAHCARKLESMFDVTLVDTKDYFEFTPSILRTIVEPSHIKKIQVLHKHYLHKARVIRGLATEITKKEVKVNGDKREFDYLIITAGSSYNAPFKEGNIVAATRAEHLRDKYEELCKAKTVLMIGGGIVGVELAGEIISHYPDKKIIIAHSGPRLIQRNHEKAIRYAEKFINKKCEVYCNERVLKQEKDHYVTSTGRKIQADLAFLCTGIKPNSDSIKGELRKIIDEKGCIKVNDYLQVEGHSNIFAAGDITDCKEEKLAQTAENHANVVIHNIMCCEKGKKMMEYKSSPKPMIISLGKWKGIFEYKNIVFNGVIPGILKELVEMKTMSKYR